jgi:hypothetical protein
MDQMFAYHQAVVRNYLWRSRWGVDASGRSCRCRFGPTARAQATTWRQDPTFPRNTVCALVEDPAVDLLSGVVDVLLPEPFAGELDLVREALKLACAIEEGNAWGVVAALAGVALAMGTIAYATNNDQRATAFGRRSSSLVRPSRPPQSLSRPSRR